MKYKNIGTIDKIIKVIKENFDNKITTFPEIMKTVNKNGIKVKNVVIRQVLYFLESINAVTIGKGLSGHFSMYDNIVIEDYKFNFDGVKNYISKEIDKFYKKHETDELEIAYVPEYGSIYIDPFNNDDFLYGCTTSNVKFYRLPKDTLKEHFRRMDATKIIKQLIQKDPKELIKEEIVKIIISSQKSKKKKAN